MAIGKSLRGSSPKYYALISPEELFTHFSEIQAGWILGHSDDLLPELEVAAGAYSQ